MNEYIGQSLGNGKYQITQRIGRGGMAEVYKAYQPNLARHVAIKMLHMHLLEEETLRSRFEQEAKHIAALDHPNIIRVYDVDREGEVFYIVMEYVEGNTLKHYLKTLYAQGKRLSLSRGLEIILEIAAALAYAHKKGMIHRDVKPANVMLNREGRAILTDFGIAKMTTGPQLTMTGALVGTPAYMSPESAQGQKSDARTDVYSLGVMLYEIATGKLPYEADEINNIHSHSGPFRASVLNQPLKTGTLTTMT